MTNQASELETKVIEIVATIPMFTGAELNEIGWEKYGENEKDAIAKLLELIRNEKLKLLAAVRERVVGEDWRYLMTHELFSYEFLAKEYAKAELRASQRKVLDKLEAEL